MIPYERLPESIRSQMTKKEYLATEYRGTDSDGERGSASAAGTNNIGCLLPVIVFCFSKKKCEEIIDFYKGQDLLNATEKGAVFNLKKTVLGRLNASDAKLPQVSYMFDLLSRGFGVHHGGLLPILKESVEVLFSQSIVKVLVATETFAMGVNMPARSVVFSGTRKHDGRNFRDLLPGEYTQMAGRAGRRGLDKVGTVIVAAWTDLPTEVGLKTMVTGTATKLSSRFRLTYNMILNLLRANDLNVEDMIKRSFSEFSMQRALSSRDISSTIARLEHYVELIEAHTERLDSVGDEDLLTLSKEEVVVVLKSTAEEIFEALTNCKSITQHFFSACRRQNLTNQNLSSIGTTKTSPDLFASSGALAPGRVLLTSATPDAQETTKSASQGISSTFGPSGACVISGVVFDEPTAGTSGSIGGLGGGDASGIRRSMVTSASASSSITNSGASSTSSINSSGSPSGSLMSDEDWLKLAYVWAVMIVPPRVYSDVTADASSVTEETEASKPSAAAAVERGPKPLKRQGDDEFGGYKLKGGPSSINVDNKHKTKELVKQLDFVENTYPLDGSVEYAIIKLRLSDIALITDVTLPNGGLITSNNASEVKQVAESLVRLLKPNANDGDINALNLPRAFKRIDVDATVQQDRLAPLAKHVLQCTGSLCAVMLIACFRDTHGLHIYIYMFSCLQIEICSIRSGFSGFTSASLEQPSLAARWFNSYIYIYIYELFKGYDTAYLLLTLTNSGYCYLFRYLRSPRCFPIKIWLYFPISSSALRC
jgi:hypothetical protein